MCVSLFASYIHGGERKTRERKRERERESCVVSPEKKSDWLSLRTLALELGFRFLVILAICLTVVENCLSLLSLSSPSSLLYHPSRKETFDATFVFVFSE
jgi:hypothetical protein